MSTPTHTRWIDCSRTAKKELVYLGSVPAGRMDAVADRGLRHVPLGSFERMLKRYTLRSGAERRMRGDATCFGAASGAPLAFAINVTRNWR